MEAILERELNRAQRYKGTLSLAFIDLDDFKQVNDGHGHDVGDQLLQYVATGMEQMVRASDVVTRYAGDEFVILLPETSLDNARQLVARMQERFLRQPLVLQGQEIPVRLSAGLASTETPAATAGELLRRADQELYQTKNQRKHTANNCTPA
jgi:diguanylate cyclase (GGDEF)-like protein